MSAVLMLVRLQRRALRTWVSLALLLAVVGGGVLAAGAGARRTDTAYPRFLAASNTGDLEVSTVGSSGPVGSTETVLHGIEKLPQVAFAGEGYFVVGNLRLASGRLVDVNDVSPIALPDARYGRSLDRFKLLDGRLPDPGRVDEISVSFPFANDARFRTRVGDVLAFRLLLPRDMDAITSAAGATAPSLSTAATGPVLHLHVVGVMASPLGTDFPPLVPGNGASIYLTPAFLHRYQGIGELLGGLAVKLHHGLADLPAFELAAEKLAGDTQLQFNTAIGHEQVVQSTIHLQALGLGLLAGLAAAVVLLVLAQGVARRVALDSADHPALRALGATRGQLWAAGMARAVLAGVAGAAGAVVVAVALSPLTPVGNARVAEPDPGIHLDAAVVLGGAAALALLVALMAALPAWRASRTRRDDRVAPSLATRIAELLSRAGLPATAVSGVRLALEPGRGRTSVPVRSAIAACVVATATVGAALTFSASLGHVLDTPRLYGWNWDAQLGGLVDSSPAPGILAGLPYVSAFALGTTGDIDVGGQRVGGLAMDPGKGSLEPEVLSGRAPHGNGEILLGSQDDPQARIGDLLTVHIGGNAEKLRLVGRGVLPILSDTAHLGTGAWLSFGALHRLLGDTSGIVQDTFLVRLSGDRAAALAKLVARFGTDSVVVPSAPTGLVGFGDLSALPIVLAGVLAAGAVATLAHAVFTSVQRRRRDLAILKTMGFVRGQVAVTVAWQTTTIAAIAVVIGAPLGAIAGRWAWVYFAGQQGLLAEPVLPLASLLLMLPAALLVGNLVAAIPGRFAARTSPALVLRAE